MNFLPKYHRVPFYLLRDIHSIDKFLKLTKYPSELKKTQHTLTAYIHFNANEYRSLINYPLLYLLQNKFENQIYYYRIVKGRKWFHLRKKKFYPRIFIPGKVDFRP